MTESPTISLEAAFDALTAGMELGLGSASGPADFSVLGDDHLLATTATIERLGRRLDALRVAAAAELGHRSRPVLGAESLAVRKGCRNAIELLRRVTLVSTASAGSRLKLGAATRDRYSLSGDAFPAVFPRVASELAGGRLGVDAAAAIIRGLSPLGDRVDYEALSAAEGELVASATGTLYAPLDSMTPVDAGSEFLDGPEAPLPATADDIYAQAQVWRAVLDPDGLEPAENKAMDKRAFSRGRLRDGLLHGTYAFLPEIAAKFDRLFDACLSPRTTGVFLTDDEGAASDATAEPRTPDQRTPDQQRHDAVAAMVDGFARSGDAPTIGGAAPTIMVSVRADDLTSGRGAGYVDGTDGSDIPLSMHAVRQLACTGGVQSVSLDINGQIIQLGSPQRCFTPNQRRAITLRDGGCIIPGCRVPAAWCEIHHVTPDADGGPTHTGNGVLVCWFHHRTIDTSGWQIRMRDGAPQVSAPPWLGDTQQWRPAGRSPTAMAERIDRRERC